jgi:hypothetical protein
MIRTAVPVMRVLAIALLIFAATQPIKIYTWFSAFRPSEGSQGPREVKNVAYLWQEAGPQPGLWFTSVLAFHYAWPLVFFLIRKLLRNRKTLWPIGVMEILVGGFCLAGVLTLHEDLVWIAHGAGDLHMSFGYYLTIFGYIIYLVAWPVEVIFGGRALSGEVP